MDLRSELKQTFGFDDFRPGQESVIRALLDHGRSLAVFPTGGGKSLLYQLPALLLPGVTLVVSPLIALMKDQIDFLRSKGVAAARLDSTLTGPESWAIVDQLERGELKLLYVAPERFNNERFLALLRRINIGLFAIDEAHCISEWGHNFRPDYLKLADLVLNLGIERVLALTATATLSVVEDICEAFAISLDGVVSTGSYRPNLNVAATGIENNKRSELLVKRIKSRKPGSTIVYVTLQKTAETVAAMLTREGIEAEAYHAGLDPESRSAIQDRWMLSPTGVVVATIAFGMGIDKADVRYVYHYNMPKSIESFSQEIGRAGRDGLKSTVESFLCGDDVPTLENFVYGDTPTREALKGLISDLASREEEFDVSLYDLSSEHDLRPLVLRTALTYLELEGALHQGSPFYAGYEFRPKATEDEIAASFKEPHSTLIRHLFTLSKMGRTWRKLDPDYVAGALGEERRRIVRALETLEERQLIELRASDVRNRFTRIFEPEDADELTKMLAAKFEKREQSEISRLHGIIDLLSGSSCLVNGLANYFGDMRTEPCGHCSYCVTQRAARLPEPAPEPPIEELVQIESISGLRRAFPIALATPRQCARFLAALSSPAQTKAKLGSHPLSGKLEGRRFSEILSFCDEAFAN